jgi:hypothetical protein
MKSDLELLFQYVQENKRVCPLPQTWNQLWELLPNKKRKGNGWEPSAPLILAAWHNTSDNEKRERLKSHIYYSFENKAFNVIDSFLRNLKDEDCIIKKISAVA